MGNYIRNKQYLPRYVRGNGPVVQFNPNRAYIQHATQEFLNNGGKIKKRKRVLGEPEYVAQLFKRPKNYGYDKHV